MFQITIRENNGNEKYNDNDNDDDDDVSMRPPSIDNNDNNDSNDHMDSAQCSAHSGSIFNFVASPISTHT